MVDEMENRQGKITYCPFIYDPPSNDCYCYKLDSLSTEAAINYCISKFDDCEIYKKQHFK